MLVQYFINYNLPGVEHCFGGPGPSWVNCRDELDKWMETGTAPDQVTAYWLDEKCSRQGRDYSVRIPMWQSMMETNHGKQNEEGHNVRLLKLYF